MYSLRLLPTAVEESHVEVVLYSCWNHPVYEKVIMFMFSLINESMPPSPVYANLVY